MNQDKFLMAVFFLFNISIISILVYQIGDRVLLDSQIDGGVVASKQYHKEYETESCYDAGEVEICDDIVHPERWEIIVQIGKDNGGVFVSEKFYNSTSISQGVNIEYKKGRFSGDLYIKSIQAIVY